MKKIVSPIFLLITVMVLFSCNNTIDIIAPYKETPVIYGLLNQSDSIHYIRINKAFLGQGDAYQMAQVQDSTQYSPDRLSVEIQQWRNGSQVNTYQLTSDTSIAKVPGVFSYPNQVVYKFKDTLYEDSQYNLVVTDNKTGHVATSQTNLIHDFTVLTPAELMTSINMSNPNNAVKWQSAVNGKIYQLTIRFHYKEIDNSTQAVTDKYVDWVFGSVQSSTISGGENMEVDFGGEDFYKFLKSIIPVNNNVHRQAGDLDYIFTVGSNDLNTYMQVSQPSLGIVQEKPMYTNITDGIGLFTARYTKDMAGKHLAGPALDSLYAGMYTADLGFCDPNATSPYHCQ